MLGCPIKIMPHDDDNFATLRPFIIWEIYADA